MIFITHIKNAKAAKDYYSQHIAPGDGKYYSEENAQQLRPFWVGDGAERLHLRGEVKQEDFFALCENRNPMTGKRITPRTNDDRRVLTDITFDIPKGVTLAGELGGEEGKGDKRIQPLVIESILETASEMEIDANVSERAEQITTGRPEIGWHLSLSTRLQGRSMVLLMRNGTGISRFRT